MAAIIIIVRIIDSSPALKAIIAKLSLFNEAWTCQQRNRRRAAATATSLAVRRPRSELESILHKSNCSQYLLSPLEACRQLGAWAFGLQGAAKLSIAMSLFVAKRGPSVCRVFHLAAKAEGKLRVAGGCRTTGERREASDPNVNGALQLYWYREEAEAENKRPHRGLQGDA